MTTKKTKATKVAKKKSTQAKKLLIDHLKGFLESSGFSYQTDKDPNILNLQFDGKTSYRALFDVKKEKGIILFYMFGPVNVPEEKIPDASKFIALANFGLQVGNLEIDIRDGEVRYKSILVCEGTTPRKSTFKRFIYPALISMSKYYPNLLKLIYTDTTPEQAVAEAEKEKDPEQAS